jgi:uncharacterized OsmC-like protein
VSSSSSGHTADPDPQDGKASAGDEQAGERVLMRSRSRIEVTSTPDKLVTGPTESVAVPMGMHGELAEFYGAPPGFTPHASTLDYVIGATGACLAGTFKRALAARGIVIAPENLKAEVEGVIVVDDGVPVIRRIEVSYELAGFDRSDVEKIERAHAVHHRACAVSRSLERAIDISTSLRLASD